MSLRQPQHLAVLLCLLLCNLCKISESLIVPQELPSILSLVYSNIPPIKKGTDSRLGFGFRLGEHADFQVMLELGPQKETRPIGDQDNDSSFNKRQISASQQRALLLKLYQQQQQILEQQEQHVTSTERNAVNWLENWSKDMQSSKKRQKQKQNSSDSLKPTNFIEGIPPIPLMPTDALQQLQLLYKFATTSTTSTTMPTTITNNVEEAKPVQWSPEANKELPQEAPAEINSTSAPKKTKAEITKELMDVSLEEGE